MIEFDCETTQAEAIPPDTLAEIILDGIRGRIRGRRRPKDDARRYWLEG